jgi:hypothetical protein
MAVLGRRSVANLIRKSGFHILRLSLSCLERALITATTFWRDEGSASSLELQARVEMGILDASKRKGRRCQFLECVNGSGKRSNRKLANL